MREVIGRAVRTGLFPGGAGPHTPRARADGTNDAGVDTLPTAAIPGTASVAPPTAGLPRRERFRAALEALAGVVARGVVDRSGGGHRRRRSRSGSARARS